MSDTSSGAAVYAQANKPTVPLLNPLEAYAKAGQIAQGMNANKLFQAQQLAGQAFQNSIGPDGMPNQVALNQGLVAAGPGAALAAQDASQKGQTLDNSTLDTNLKRISGLNNAAIALTAQYPNGVPLDAATAEIDRVAPQYGMTPQQVAQAKAGLSSNPVANTRTIIRNSISRLSTMDALHASRPGVITADDGQVVRGGTTAPLASDAPGVINVPGAPPVAGGQGFQKQTGPESNAAQTPQYIADPQHPGQYLQVPTPRSAMPGASGVTTPPPAGPPAPIPYNGAYRPRGPMGGAQPTQTPATPSSAGATATPAPATGGQAQPTTTPVTPDPATSGATPTATPTPAAPTYLSAPPQGQPDQLAAGYKVYNDAATAKPAQQQRLVAGESALQALNMASSIGTGPGTSTVAQVQAFLEAHGGAPPQGQLSPVDYRQLLQKNLLRFAQSSGTTAGTDLGLETQLHSNANVEDMLPNANRHVLVQDLGLLRRNMAQTDLMPQGAAAIEHVKNFGNNNDPRAFAFGDMTPGERAAVIAQANAQDQAVDPSGKSHPNLDKFRASLTTAMKLGYVKPDPPPPAAAPSPPAPVVATPLARPTNALAGPQVPTN